MGSRHKKAGPHQMVPPDVIELSGCQPGRKEVHRHAPRRNCIAVTPHEYGMEPSMGEPPPPYGNPTHPREGKEEKGQA
jgi:hypothetical protein